MKLLLCAAILGLMSGTVLHAQVRRCTPWTDTQHPPYQLSVTPLDWRFASKTGLSSKQIEDHVRRRILEELVWISDGSPKIGGTDDHHKAKISVELDIGTRMRKVTYTFRVTVNTPENWSRALPAAWEWSQVGQGVSRTNHYPQEFRKEMDLVLEGFAKAWRAHLQE